MTRLRPCNFEKIHPKSYSLLFFFILLASSSYGQDCGDAGIEKEEGSTMGLNCYTSVASKLSWKVRRNGQMIAVGFCMNDGQCTEHEPSKYRLTHSTYKTFTAALTIVSVDRNDNFFECERDDYVTDEGCQLDVYIKPGAPECEDAVLADDNSALSIKCVTDNVYPPFPRVNFSLSLISTSTSFISHYEFRSCQNFESTKTNGDYRVECNIWIPITDVRAGELSFEPSAYPLINNGQSLATTKGLPTSPVVLREPKGIQLSSDCPNGANTNDGSIMAGGRATCKCVLTSLGYPPGHAQWYDKSNPSEKLGTVNLNDGSATITLEYDPNKPNRTFECYSETILIHDSAKVSFSPTFAIGPSRVGIEVSESTFDLSQSPTHTLAVTCTVSHDDVKPLPVFDVEVNGEQIDPSWKRGNLLKTGIFSYTESFRPTTVGPNQVKCRSKNYLFDNLIAESQLKVDVIGDSEDDKSSSALIIGLGVGIGIAVLIIVIVVVLVILKRRKGQAAKSHAQGHINQSFDAPKFERYSSGTNSTSTTTPRFEYPPPVYEYLDLVQDMPNSTGNKSALPSVRNNIYITPIH